MLRLVRPFVLQKLRGSNSSYTVGRLLNCTPDDAAKFLTGKTTDAEMAELRFDAIRMKTAKLMRKQEDEKKETIKGLDAILKDIQNRKMSERAYQFFIHPPGKKHPTNISRETVDRYKVFERTWGVLC